VEKVLQTALERFEHALHKVSLVKDALADASVIVETIRSQAGAAVHARRLPDRVTIPRAVVGGQRQTSPKHQPSLQDSGDARVRRRELAARSASSNGHLPPAKQKILNGLAFLHGIGVAPADKTQLALLVGVSPTSGGYFNNLGALRSDGLIDYPTGGTVALTDAGAEHASTDGVPSTTDELHDAIRAKLPPSKWKILEELIREYPNAITKDALAERIDVSPTSGGYFNNLGSLRSLGLLDYPQPGTVAALPVLFLER
jgi:Mn-dependent DtxR family transcriptional regulator